MSAGIESVIDGVRLFKHEVFDSRKEQFSALARGQSPQVLIVACSDSRVVPQLITQTQPGDLFVLRNAGNILPPHGANHGGEEATIEYAVTALGVRHIVICGHSHCGAVKGLLSAPQDLVDMPSVADWLVYAEATRRAVAETHANLEDDARLLAAVKENVIVQIGNLFTYPSVFAKHARGELRVHGWVYMIESGEVLAYDPDSRDFRALALPAAEPARG